MTPTRKAILDGLAEFGQLFPDWRLGQIVTNLCWWARGPEPLALSMAQDLEVLAALHRVLQRNAHRSSVPDVNRTDLQDPEVRFQALTAVEELGQQYPDWQIGQLMATVTEWAKDERNWGAYDIEDADFLTAARTHLREHVPANIAKR